MEKTNEIVIIKRPDWISFDMIHDLLYKAHENNREKGLIVNTAEMDSKALAAHIGNGECFVALDKEKLVGVTAVRIVERHNRFANGEIADQILVAVLPEYKGQHISTRLHEKVIDFCTQHGINQIEIRTANNNAVMQSVCKKWGFRAVDFFAFKNIHHYTILLMKWLNKCPYSQDQIDRHFKIRKMLVQFRYKPGKRKRFGL